MAQDFCIRPMRDADAADVERLTDDSFYDLDVRTHRTGWPAPARRSPQRSVSWQRRLGHLLAHDPGGCWVAEDATGLVGAAVALRRDTTWILATFAVRPGRQGRGIGRPLLEAALSYGRGCTRAMLAASEDPLAVRRYRAAGFDLHPTMLLWGQVSREVLPVVEHVREGSASDVDLMDSVDRQVRGAAHGVDHELLLGAPQMRLVVTDRPTGSGYVYVEPNGRPYLLAATSRRAATSLLWEALAATSPEEPVLVSHLTVDNGWAVDVGMAARMEMHTRGYLALRAIKRPPAPYLPSGSFL